MFCHELTESHTWAHWIILSTILHNVAFLFKLKKESTKEIELPHTLLCGWGRVLLVCHMDWP
uniref:Putative ovule protein n=1 Tax=Solanum chacoense TaxID=4108 RepID=A0A0V0HH90_SOLCH